MNLSPFPPSGTKKGRCRISFKSPALWIILPATALRLPLFLAAEQTAGFCRVLCNVIIFAEF